MLMQCLAEWGGGLAIAADPYRIPEGHPNWAGDSLGRVAMVSRHARDTPPMIPVSAGEGFTLVEWGPIDVAGCYFPPRLTRREYEEALESLGEHIRRRSPRPVVVGGDFNAHALEWGSPSTDSRGDSTLLWAARHGLVLLNRGRASTFVGARGESIVDLTWATPVAATRIHGWHVDASSLGEMSDHHLIRMELVSTPAEVSIRRRLHVKERRWALRKLDPGALEVSLLSSTWPEPNPALSVEEEAEWLEDAMSRACDASMPRCRGPVARRAAYWWSEELAQLRRATVAARRGYTRRRRRGTDAEVEVAAGALRDARSALRTAIRRAKADAWRDLVSSLDRDPWGRPYKIVTKRFRPWAPPITETLDARFLEDVVTALFPNRERDIPERAGHPSEWTEELSVTGEEMEKAFARLKGRPRAPGPSGIHGRVWLAAAPIVGGRLRQLFTSCLRDGIFPRSWKRARLVLLRKEGKPAESPSAYRPICLLDDAGKLLERVIAARIVQHLSRDGPNLSRGQYGFREGLSTVDAVRQVRALSEQLTAGGRVALAVSLDIANAFNSVPWGQVVGALGGHHLLPPYLVAIIRDYFRDRKLEFLDKEGLQQRRDMSCGVPQGSVLGPLLWNVAYDKVLRAALPPGCHVVCYADDTLVVAGGTTWERAVGTANVAVACVVGSIKELGLRVAPAKSEALFFHDGKSGVPPQAHIEVDDVRIPVRPTIKYLGLTVDGRWGFVEHFDELAPRLGRRADALLGLMPNLHGPNESVRRLYMNAVLSGALYGAPVWSGKALASRRIKARLHNVQRRLALRICRAYRTVSYAAVMVLAGIPPVEHVADALAETFARVKAIRLRGGIVTPGTADRLRRNARRRVFEEWRATLENDPPTTGARTVEAILPCLEAWVGRGWGGLSFHATQVLTGHGCFGEYLCRIGKEPTTVCRHCDGDRDTAQHTLEACPAWAGERGVLVREIGGDLSLPAIVRAMVGRESAWTAFSSFCDRVMSQKEEAERRRERAPGGRGPLPPPPPPGGGDEEGGGDARVGGGGGSRGRRLQPGRSRPGPPPARARRRDRPAGRDRRPPPSPIREATEEEDGGDACGGGGAGGPSASAPPAVLDGPASRTRGAESRRRIADLRVAPPPDHR